METEEIAYQVTVEFLGANLKNVSKKSNKFYEVSVLKTTDITFPYIIRIRYGKFGAKGTTKLHSYSYSIENAKRCVDALIQKKRKKGYTDPINALTRLATALDD